MINFFKNAEEKIFNLKKMDQDTLIYRVLPRLLMEIIKKYFRLEIEGLENIPKKGPVIVAPNHSGFAGFDAAVLTSVIQKETKRLPRTLTHYFWFLNSTTAIPAHKMGFIEATYENGLNLLSKNNLIVLFPEGESGNFKPSTKRYELQEFKRGFVRLALERQCPIVPTLIIGAEETHINLSKLKFTKFLRGLVIPLPLNIIPLPVKWKIIFLEPIYLPYDKSFLENTELVHELAQDIQEQMQRRLRQEVKQRGLKII